MIYTSKRPVGDTGCWIRRSTRLAIHARDGFACCYCGTALRSANAVRYAADGEMLQVAQLDHVDPRCIPGRNRPENLATCCEECNVAKAALPLAVFISKLPVARHALVGVAMARVGRGLSFGLRAAGAALAKAGL